MTISSDECARRILDVVPLIMRAIRAEMRSHRAPDLGVPQFRTLAYLNRHEGASLSDAAEHIGLTLPSMSSLINGLVARHLVARQTHAGDRRRVTLALTERGRTVLQISHEAAQDRLAKLIAVLPASERVAVGRAMQALHPVFMPGHEAEQNER